MIELKPDLTANEAVKVSSLCSRILGDIGSIHGRVTPAQSDGRASPMPVELVELRRHIRELQDAVQGAYPSAFFK